MYWRIERQIQLLYSLLKRVDTTKNNLIAKLYWSIKKNSFPKNKNADGKTLFHIGCGEINSPEFINIDARKNKHIHIVTQNISRLWMIPSNTAGLVYMCHILEHVPRNKTPSVLKEMLRILKPNGKLRLSVPDFDCILAIYNDTNHDIKSISPPLMGGQDYPENFHYEVFNHEYLAGLLKNNGFTNISKWDPLAVEHHNFDDWASKKVELNSKHYLISLNLEASKPN